MPRPVLLCALAIVLSAFGCNRAAAPVSRQVLTWQPVGTWSGQHNVQTESFTSNTGVFRLTWEAHDIGAEPGHLQITLHSAVSGRPLVEAVDHRGSGADSIEVTEDPREFYVVIAAAGTKWSLKVEEGISLILTPKR